MQVTFFMLWSHLCTVSLKICHSIFILFKWLAFQIKNSSSALSMKTDETGVGGWRQVSWKNVFSITWDMSHASCYQNGKSIIMLVWCSLLSSWRVASKEHGIKSLGDITIVASAEKKQQQLKKTKNAAMQMSVKRVDHHLFTSKQESSVFLL